MLFSAQIATALRVPLESATSSFRLRQKQAEKTAQELLQRIEREAEVTAGAGTAAGGASVTASTDAIDILDQLEALINSGVEDELASLTTLAKRLEALVGNDVKADDECDLMLVEALARARFPDTASSLMRQNPRLKPFAQTRGEEKSDRGIIKEVTAIADALAAKKKSALPRALLWAQSHASRLRRIESTLEFELRKQEFLELVKDGDLPAALAFASRKLAPAAKAATPEPSSSSSSSTSAAGPSLLTSAAGPGTALEDGLSRFRPSPDSLSSSGSTLAPLQALQQVMAVLAFPNPLKCGVPHVERLFNDEHGSYYSLARRFEADALAACGFFHVSPLQHAVLTGLMSLKTINCGSNSGRSEMIAVPRRALRLGPEEVDGTGNSDEGSSDGSSASLPAKGFPLRPELPALLSTSDAVAQASHGCPLCLPHFFASTGPQVPFLRPPHSLLLDPLTGEEMTGANYPLALPNGHVYGAKTLELLTISGAEGGEKGEGADETLFVVDPRGVGAGGKDDQPQLFEASSVRRVFVI